MMKLLLILAVVIATASADLYLHNPRGSNNRLDEANRNRAANNRLFDSQNNNKGGYNVNRMEYYGGSELQVEWTNQHSCGDKHAECQLIMQYMCEKPSGVGIRNGQQQARIPEGKDTDHNYGRHESATYFADCKARQRNLGLFTADQDMGGETAEYTRQNNDENAADRRRGYECPEERDYYPYWHPTPWKDIAVFTTQPEQRCPLYVAESENVFGKGYCDGLRKATPGNDKTSGSEINNQAECDAIAEFEWKTSEPHGLPAPECIDATTVWSRVNHLGNAVNAYQNKYNWRLPSFGEDMVCVFRMRYNISTTDFDGWATDYTSNIDPNDPEAVVTNYAMTEDPTVDVGSEGTEIKLKLRISTDQMGRTFQDRSSTFLIKPSPVSGRIINLNVMGQRGNIVENYPSVEYDFVPQILRATTSTYIHRQVTGSNTTPNGAGNGAANTDRSNFIGMYNNELARTMPAMGENITQFNVDMDTKEGAQLVAHYALFGQNDDQMDDASPHQDLGLMRYTATGTHHFLSSRNNDFSNRSQKGTIIVTAPGEGKSKKVDAAKIAIIAGGSVAGVVVVGGGAAYVATHRDMFSFGGGGAKAPAGYA